MKNKTKYKIVLVIFIISLLSSIILSIGKAETFCGPDSSGCNIVQNSKYATTFGLKNSYFGIVGFLFLSILTIMHIKKPKTERKEIINLGIIISFIVAIYFFFLQFLIIKNICKYCMIVDVGAVINFILITYRRKKWK